MPMLLRCLVGSLLLRCLVVHFSAVATATPPLARPNQADTVNASSDAWLKQQSFEHWWRYEGLANLSGLPWFRHYRFFTEPCSSQNGSTYIPRIIHQTGPFATTNELPPKIKEMMDRMKGLNPGWEHRYYNHDDRDAYIATHFPEMLDHYRAINPDFGAAQADLFRYLAIYREGGVYLDLKSTVLVPLDSLLKTDDEYVIFPSFVRPCCRNYHPELAMFAIMSRPQHPFLKAVIERVTSNIVLESETPGSFGNSSDRFRMLKLTSSYAYTDTIYPMLNQTNHRPLIGTCIAPVIHTVLTSGTYNAQYLPGMAHYQDVKSNLVLTSKPLKHVSLVENLEVQGGGTPPPQKGQVPKSAGMCAAIAFTNVTSMDWNEMLSVLLHSLAKHEPALPIRLQIGTELHLSASLQAYLAKRNITIFRHEEFEHNIQKGDFEWRGSKSTSLLSKFSAFSYTDCSYVLVLDADVIVRMPFVHDLLEACDGAAENEWDICGVSDLPDGEKPVDLEADLLSLRSPNSGMWLLRPNRSKEVLVRDFLADWDFERSMGALEQEVATILSERGIFSFSFVSIQFNQGPLHVKLPDAYIYHFAGSTKPRVQYRELGNGASPAVREWISSRAQLSHIIGEQEGEIAIVSLFYTLNPELLQMLTVFEATLRKHEPELPFLLLVEKRMHLSQELVRDLANKRITVQRYMSLDLPNPRNARHLLQGDKMMLFNLTQYRYVVYMDLDQIILRPFVNDLHAACNRAFSGEQFDVCGLPQDVSDGHIWGSLWFVRPSKTLFGTAILSLKDTLAELETKAFSVKELFPGIDEVAQTFLEEAGKLRVARVHNGHFNAQPDSWKMLQKDNIYIYHFLGAKPPQLLKVHGNDAPPYALAWEKALKEAGDVIGDMVPAHDCGSGKCGSQLKVEPMPVQKTQRLYAFELEDCIVQNCLGPYLKLSELAFFRPYLRGRTMVMMRRRDWSLFFPALWETYKTPLILPQIPLGDVPVALEVVHCVSQNGCMARGRGPKASWLQQLLFLSVPMLAVSLHILTLYILWKVIKFVGLRIVELMKLAAKLMMRYNALKTTAGVRVSAVGFLLVGLCFAAHVPPTITPQSIICDAMQRNITIVQVGVQAKEPGNTGIFAQCGTMGASMYGTVKGVVTEAYLPDFHSMSTEMLTEFGEGAGIRPLNVAVSAEQSGIVQYSKGRSITPAQLLEESYLQSKNVDMLIVNVGRSVNVTIVFEFFALPGFDPHTIILRNMSTAVGQNDLVGKVMLDALKHRGFNSTSESNYIVMWRKSKSVVR